jgi:alkylated DNA repair protein alkB family protein 6
MYKNTLHGIDEIEKDDNLGPESIVNWSMLGDQKPFVQGSAERIGTRISLTYRDVLKVRKLGGVAKFMTKR